MTERYEEVLTGKDYEVTGRDGFYVTLTAVNGNDVKDIPVHRFPENSGFVPA